MSMATLLLPSDAARFDVARTIVAASAALGPAGPPTTTRAAPASTDSTAPTATTGSQLRRCGPAVPGGRTFIAPAGGHAGASGGIGAGGTGVSASYTSRLSCAGKQVWIRRSEQKGQLATGGFVGLLVGVGCVGTSTVVFGPVNQFLTDRCHQIQSRIRATGTTMIV